MSYAKMAAVVFLMLTLTACQHKNVPPPVATISLPKAPEYYAQCFKKLTPIPLETLTRADVVRLAAELRRSELRHSKCGKDLLKWYATVRAAYAAQPK